MNRRDFELPLVNEGILDRDIYKFTKAGCTITLNPACTFMIWKAYYRKSPRQNRIV